MFWRRNLAVGLALALLAAAARVSPAAEPEPKKAKIGEAVRIQRNARNQLEALLRIMQNIVASLEKTDPAAARTIANAADQAQSALVTEDMDKVVQLMLGGMVVPADATQALILRRLRDILEALRAGGEAGLDARIILLAKLQAMIAVVQEMLRQQKVLERTSRLVAAGPKNLPRFKGSRDKIKELLDRQRALMTKMEKLAVDEVQGKIAQARQVLLSHAGRLDEMVKQMGVAFPSPDQVGAWGALHKTFHRSALTAYSDLKALAGEAAMSGVADELKAAGSSFAKTVDEVAKCADALAKDDLKNARLADAEAKFLLKEALSATSAAFKKRAAATGASGMIAEQETLTRETEELAKTVEELAPRVEVQATSGGGLGVAAILPSNPYYDVMKPRPSTDTGQLALVAEAAGSAAERLGAGDKEGALMEQSQAVANMEAWLERLSKHGDEVRDLVENPDYPRQEVEQRTIGDKLSKIGTGQLHLAPEIEKLEQQPKEEGSEKQTMDILREANVNVRKAGEHAGTAAEHLKVQKPVDANYEQNLVISMLEQTLQNLSSECARTANEVLEELAQQWIAVLERALSLQKSVSADTIAVWQKRKPDGTYLRAEQLAFTGLVQGEELVLNTLDEMQDVMSKAVAAHMKVEYPPLVHMLLAMVRRDLGLVKNRLFEKDAAEPTQRMQKDVETRLEAMMAAMAGKKDNDQLPTRPPLWGDNGVGNPDASKKGREMEIEMMIAIQGEIMRRTEDIQTTKAKGGPLPPTVDDEYKELIHLEFEIRRAIRDWVLKDLMEIPGSASGKG